MYLLALDSTAQTASVAIAEDDKIIASMVMDNGKTHSEQLLPMAENCLARVGLSCKQLDAFSCTVGPGSFTGVRIGVSTLKGLAFGTKKPCVPISTLRAIAENLRPLDGVYCALMDARRGEVYTALFTKDQASGNLVRLAEDSALSFDELALLLQENDLLKKGAPLFLAGDGMNVAAKALTAKGIPFQLAPSLLANQHAASVARCALQDIRNAAPSICTDRTIAPLYLRVPQAERERLAKQAALQNK